MTNHGGVCLMYDVSLHTRPVQLPTFSSFEVVGAYLHRAGFNAVVVVIYRPGSSGATQAFLDDFNDLLERLATFSTPLIIVGDFNIHVDDITDGNAGKLLDILTYHGLLQHVNTPTHRHGHSLDLIITRRDQIVDMLPIDEPLLSDHSFVVAECSCSLTYNEPVQTRLVRNWRSIDVDTFATELQQSDLIVSLPQDIVAAIDCYDSTLREMLNKHAPLVTRRIRTRSIARWYDRECRDVKRTTRKLERNFRRSRTAESLTAWRQQFDSQRRIFQSKFVTFWSMSVDACKNNSRILWRTVNNMLQPPQRSTSQKLAVDDFATYFRDKASNIRSSTASAAAPVITVRQVKPLSSFEPVTVDEVVRLMNKAPAKSSALDPIPTWLLKRLTIYIAPVICRLCNMSLETGTFPLQLKQAWVTPLLKKPNLDQDTTSSYRPISNLSYLSKIVERVIVSRFTKHASKSNLFPVHQSAYRPFHSTETAILSVHNDLVRSIDNGMLSPLILLDLFHFIFISFIVST
jgi:hypothetical protein